jgi:excisionase family DNA binding protein
MSLPDLATLVRAAAPDELPALIGQLAAAQAEALARLITPSRSNGNEGEDRLLTLPQVAEALGIPEEHARELGRRGELPVVHVGRYVRVRAASLAKWIELREQKGLDRGLSAVLSMISERRRRSEGTQGARAQTNRIRGARGSPSDQRQPVGARRGSGHDADREVDLTVARVPAQG